MAIRDILKMGDPRLLRIAPPVMQFDTDELHLLITDMLDTMRAANGAGLAAPQIGVDLQLVIFGTDERNPRYPDAPPVPRTVLINPVITPLPLFVDGDRANAGSARKKTGKVACPCPVCGPWCHDGLASNTQDSTSMATRSTARWKAFTPGWCSTSVIT